MAKKLGASMESVILKRLEIPEYRRAFYEEAGRVALASRLRELSRSTHANKAMKKLLSDEAKELVNDASRPLQCGKCSRRREWDEKLAKEFGEDSLYFARFYCDVRNIWEEGALWIAERLEQARKSGQLSEEQKSALEKVEKLVRANFMNIPKHARYVRDLEKLISTLHTSRTRSPQKRSR